VIKRVREEKMGIKPNIQRLTVQDLVVMFWRLIVGGVVAAISLLGASLFKFPPNTNITIMIAALVLYLMYAHTTITQNGAPDDEGYDEREI
jgi:hypothetical protein